MVTLVETKRETVPVEVDLTPEEILALREEATADGQTVDQFLRAAALDHLKSRWEKVS